MPRRKGWERSQRRSAERTLKKSGFEARRQDFQTEADYSAITDAQEAENERLEKIALTLARKNKKRTTNVAMRAAAILRDILKRRLELSHIHIVQDPDTENGRSYTLSVNTEKRKKLIPWKKEQVTSRLAVAEEIWTPEGTTLRIGLKEDLYQYRKALWRALSQKIPCYSTSKLEIDIDYEL